MCHGYVALLGSDDQVLFILNLLLTISLEAIIPPQFPRDVLKHSFESELGLEPGGQPPSAQRGLPGQLSTAQ